MVEKEFKDRVPTYAGRVKLTPVSGQTDIFTMERADEPTEPGTPIDKALLDSITKSRLTGRFYDTTVTRARDTSLSNLTVSPIPTSGWVYDTADRLKATSGQYTVKADSDNNTSANRVADVFGSSGWQSVGGTESWIEVSHTQALKVYKIEFAVEMQAAGRLTQLEIQGSANGTTWQTLGTYSTVTAETTVEYTLSSVSDYNYYRLVFTSSSSNRITVKRLKYTLYDVSSYINEYSLNNMPLVWDRGQRLTIYTPSNVNTFAVASNTLNGVKINTILQSYKRYELTYNGTAFDAKGV